METVNLGCRSEYAGCGQGFYSGDYGDDSGEGHLCTSSSADAGLSLGFALRKLLIYDVPNVLNLM